MAQLLKKLLQTIKNQKIKKINQSQKRKRNHSREMVFPLYFGWQIRIVIERIKNLKKHIVGPFKEYWQYLSAVLVLIIIVSAGLIFKNYRSSQAATYGWIQSSWSGGASTTAMATHTSNQTNWTKYYSKDSNVSTASGQLTLDSGNSTIQQTSTDDFDNGSVGETSPCLVWGNNELKLISEVSYEGIDYPVIQIGAQCWLAKNLNVGTRIAGANNQTDNGTIEKYCYNNSEANCTTYGGLYQWNEAMQYSTTAGAQGICPSGWHIPTDAEQNTLDQYLATGTCNANRSATWDCDPAGTALKSGGSSGFNGLLAGYRTTAGSFNNLSAYAYFWSSSESGTTAWRRALGSAFSTVRRSVNAQANGFSVRCLKD